jgi:hypothetical protein
MSESLKRLGTTRESAAALARKAAKPVTQEVADRFNQLFGRKV